MNLYVVRHGQTDWNVKGHIQGLTDIKLNSKGIEQAKQTAEILKNINFSAIYSSPLERAVDTAKIINKYHNANIIIDNRIIERCFGDFEGTKNVIKDISEYLDLDLNLDTKNVESIRDLFKRIQDFLSDLYNTYKDTDKNILLVTHGGVSIAVTAIINNVKTNLISLGMKNCEYKLFENLTLNNKKENLYE